MVPKNRAGRFLEVTFSGPSGRIQRDGKHWSMRKTVSRPLLVCRAPHLCPTRMLKVHSCSQVGRGLSLCMAAFHQSLSSVPSHFLSGAWSPGAAAPAWAQRWQQVASLSCQGRASTSSPQLFPSDVQRTRALDLVGTVTRMIPGVQGKVSWCPCAPDILTSVAVI